MMVHFDAIKWLELYRVLPPPLIFGLRHHLHLTGLTWCHPDTLNFGVHVLFTDFGVSNAFLPVGAPDLASYPLQVRNFAQSFYLFKYMIYYSYKIILQSFGRLRPAVAELFLGGIWQVIHYRYEFLLNLFTFLNIWSIIATKLAYKVSKGRAQPL